MLVSRIGSAAHKGERCSWPGARASLRLDVYPCSTRPANAAPPADGADAAAQPARRTRVVDRINARRRDDRNRAPSVHCIVAGGKLIAPENSAAARAEPHGSRFCSGRQGQASPNAPCPQGSAAGALVRERGGRGAAADGRVHGSLRGGIGPSGDVPPAPGPDLGAAHLPQGPAAGRSVDHRLGPVTGAGGLVDNQMQRIRSRREQDSPERRTTPSDDAQAEREVPPDPLQNVLHQPRGDHRQRRALPLADRGPDVQLPDPARQPLRAQLLPWPGRAGVPKLRICAP